MYCRGGGCGVLAAVAAGGGDRDGRGQLWLRLKVHTAAVAMGCGVAAGLAMWTHGAGLAVCRIWRQRAAVGVLSVIIIDNTEHRRVMFGGNITDASNVGAHLEEGGTELRRLTMVIFSWALVRLGALEYVLSRCARDLGSTIGDGRRCRRTSLY